VSTVIVKTPDKADIKIQRPPILTPQTQKLVYKKN